MPLLTDQWKIIEEGWDPKQHQGSESLFSLGNGHMGQRANFEEDYSGQHLQGSYVAGIYYPDKTRVGWWKNGYPEYFAKVLNSVNWIGIKIEAEGRSLNLHTVPVTDFYRELNMKEGYLLRSFIAEIQPGKKLKIEAQRFLSLKRKEIGAIRYSITPVNFSGKLSFTPYLDFDVVNHDSNYDEKFWEGISQEAGEQTAMVIAKTKKLDFQVAAAMAYELHAGDNLLTLESAASTRNKYAENHFEIDGLEGSTYHLYKYAAVVSSLNHAKDKLGQAAEQLAEEARGAGFQRLLNEQKNLWAKYWQNSDIRIDGDAKAQQAIRYNIFQLTQTYTGDDPRLNIGPKGFTGEKYGGSTYWDTEAYCLPFYMASAGQEVAKNLLVYRYRHLEKAIENARKLGFTNGAALYPMVTMNGEECHNEWEITFEEIHRNGAIALAIYNYTRYYGDENYLAEYGLEVLIGIARFWAQRVNWSAAKEQYVMLGVTGPNEYENNVNNNWYTSYIARWTLQYTLESIETVRKNDAARLEVLLEKTAFNSHTEVSRWKDIINKMFLPEDKELGIFLQQENYLDKEQLTAADLNPAERPINQHWSWDRILRSCFIKQADVLQGIYLFEDDFDRATIERNFDFYEPRTLHESSLSPCVHVVIAAYLDKMDKAYELYLRTSRLDLDDYNKEVHEGLHITSMAGTWLSVVEGFGGMRVRDGHLHFDPKLPEGWKSLSFKIRFRHSTLELDCRPDSFELHNHSAEDVSVWIKGKEYPVQANAHTQSAYA